MKAIAFNGSARKDGNTAIMARWVFDELEKEGIETELYQMIRYCQLNFSPAVLPENDRVRQGLYFFF